MRTQFYIQTYGFFVSSTQGTQLLLGTERLHPLGVDLGVDELLNLLDLQGPIAVDGNGCDDNRFVGRLGPVAGLHLSGGL